MINAIKLTNCGRIKSYSATLDQINIFSGPDSGGKSTILQCVYAATNPHTQALKSLTDLISVNENYAAAEVKKNSNQCKVLIYPDKTKYTLNEKAFVHVVPNEFDNVFFFDLEPDNFFNSLSQQKWLFDKLCKQFPNCYATLEALIQEIRQLLTDYNSENTNPIQKQQIAQKLISARSVCKIWMEKTQTMLHETNQLFGKLHQSLFVYEPNVQFNSEPIAVVHGDNQSEDLTALIAVFTHALSAPARHLSLFVGAGVHFTSQNNFLANFSLRKKIAYLLLLDIAFVQLFQKKHKKDAVLLVDNFDFLNAKVQTFFLKMAPSLGQVLITKETTNTAVPIPSEIKDQTKNFTAPFEK